MDNKYFFDIDTINKEDTEEKRELRRKKHQQSKRAAWILLLIFVAVVGTGLFFGIRAVVRNIADGNKVVELVSEATATQPEPSDLIEDILGEAEIEITPSEPVEPEPTEEELFEDYVREFVRGMSLEDQVSGLFIVTPEQITNVTAATKAGDGTKKALETYAVGGLIYDSKNMQDPEQFKTLIENTVSLSRYPLFLAVDEELGKSTFSKEMKAASTMSPLEIYQNGDSSIAKTESEKIASLLSGYGLNLNLGVSCEVNTVGGESFMKDSCFGGNPQDAAPFVENAVAPFIEYNITPAIRFFPGQSSASQDPSQGLSYTVRTKTDFEESEFVTFKAAVDAGAKLAVVSHMSAESVTGETVPCSMSKVFMTDILRMEMEYHDLILITDALNKSAISSYYDSADVAINSLKAGADMLLCPEYFESARNAVIEAVNNGVIAKERVEDSLVRIYKVKLYDTFFGNE